MPPAASPGSAQGGPPTAPLPWGSSQPRPGSFGRQCSTHPTTLCRGSGAPGSARHVRLFRRQTSPKSPSSHSVAPWGVTRTVWTAPSCSSTRDAGSHHPCPPHDSAPGASRGVARRAPRRNLAGAGPRVPRRRPGLQALRDAPCLLRTNHTGTYEVIFNINPGEKEFLSPLQRRGLENKGVRAASQDNRWGQQTHTGLLTLHPLSRGHLRKGTITLKVQDLRQPTFISHVTFLNSNVPIH